MQTLFMRKQYKTIKATANEGFCYNRKIRFLETRLQKLFIWWNTRRSKHFKARNESYHDNILFKAVQKV